MNNSNSVSNIASSRIRLWFQAAWFVLTNSYVQGFAKGKIYTGSLKAICVPGLNCYSCPGALGSCPMGALQAALGDASYRISLYALGMIAVMGTLFGRLICGWMCPFGLVQDLLYRIKVKSKKKNLPGHRYLKYLRYVILVVFPVLLVSLILSVKGSTEPWFCEWICPSGTLFGGIPLVLLNDSLRAGAGWRFAWKFFLLILIVALAVFYYRPFCKYLCPLGAIYGLFNPIATYRLVVDNDKCISCGKCQNVCGMDIRTFESPNSPDCIRCGECLAACPTGAIESKWQITAQKAKERFFVDDAEAALDVKALNPAKGRTIFLGILMIIGAISCGSIAIMQLYGTFFQRDTIDYYQQVNMLYIVMQILWLLSCAILLVTGIYILYYHKDPGRLLTLREKLGLSERFAVLGLIIGIAGIVLDFGTIAIVFGPIIYEWYVLIGIPLLMPMCTMLKKKIEGERTFMFSWIAMSIVGCLLAASPWIMVYWMNTLS